MDAETVKNEIRALEEKRYQAMIALDYAGLEALLADSLVYTHSSAAVDTKASYIQGMRDGKFIYKTSRRAVEDVQVCGDTAIVTGEVRLDILARGTPRMIHARFIDVWNKGAKGWQMVAWQSTSIPA